MLNLCCIGIISSFSPIEMMAVNMYTLKSAIPSKVFLTSYDDYLNFCKLCVMFSITSVHEVKINLKSMWYYEHDHMYDWFPECVKKITIFDNVFVKKMFYFELSSIETMVIEQSCVNISLPETLKHLDVKRKFNGNITFENAVHLETISIDCTFTYFDHIDFPNSVHKITISEDFLARITRWPTELTELIVRCKKIEPTTLAYALMFHAPLSKSVNVRLIETY